LSDFIVIVVVEVGGLWSGLKRYVECYGRRLKS